MGGRGVRASGPQGLGLRILREIQVGFACRAVLSLSG